MQDWYQLYGVFGYADDLSLLCPSLEGLKEMPFFCKPYAIDYKIMFNSKKSKFMCFQKIWTWQQTLIIAFQ